MNPAGDNRVGVGDPFDLAKEINRHPADRRQQDFDIGPGDELGEHPPGLLEQGASEVGLGYPKARGHPRQMPYRIDRRFGDADFSIIEQHRPVRAQGAGGEQRAQLGSGDPCPGDRDRRAYVDAGTDMFGEDLADEMAPGVERHDLAGIRPCRARRNQRCRRGVGQIGAVVGCQRPRRDGKRAIDRIGPGIGADRVPLARLGRARDHGSAFSRNRSAPAEGNCRPTGSLRVGGQPDVPRYRGVHAPVACKQ